ncbi:protein shisa-2-like precursor [Silurus meridionalis]|nr:protein shisa-2-like precursor [Silurus meridionalis]
MVMMFSRLLHAPLLVLLLLVVSVSRAFSGGEYCHGWRDAAGARHHGFRCPERYDGEGARYCCGSCLRYCCAAPDARLDQSSCTAEFDFYTEGARNIPPSLPTYLPFVIVVSAFLSFILLGTIISICCCHCVQSKPTERPGPTHTTLLESGGPSPKSSTPSCTPISGLHPPARLSPPDLSVYSAFPPTFVTPPLHQGAPQFYPNYPNYPLPPEHTMLIAPAFLDAHGHVSPLTQNPVYPTITV